MVLTEVDSDMILVEPMKNRTAGEMIRVYQVLIDRLNLAGIFPKLHILDNKCLADLKAVIKENSMKFQLVPPHDHRRNIAKKAISTFKDNFISIPVGWTRHSLCTCGTDFSVKPSTPSICYDRQG